MGRVWKAKAEQENSPSFTPLTRSFTHSIIHSLTHICLISHILSALCSRGASLLSRHTLTRVTTATQTTTMTTTTTTMTGRVPAARAHRCHSGGTGGTAVRRHRPARRGGRAVGRRGIWMT